MSGRRKMKIGQKTSKPTAREPKPTAVRRFPCKPDIDDELTKAALHKPIEWPAVNVCDQSAVAKYAQMVEDFGHPLWWERLPIILSRVHSFASRLRLRPVADLIGTVLVRQRRGFECQVQKAAMARLEAAARMILGDADPKRNKAVTGLLLAVIALDPRVTAEMQELQRLPVGRFAVQARLLALDSAANRHWRTAYSTARRVDSHVASAMESLRAADVHPAADAQAITTRSLLRAMCKDVDLCTALANSADEELDAVDSFVEARLPGVIWSGIRRNGQPIPEDERATVGPQICGGIKSNG
jgi:hypothetical protein